MTTSKHQPAQNIETTNPLIRIIDVHKTFLSGSEAVNVLRGVSLDVKHGEIVCLMGESGSGKSTLLNILGGLETPTRGQVVIDGEDVVPLSEERLAALRLRKVGFVFQDFNLLSRFSALENVLVPMHLLRRVDEQRARELLTEVGLANRLHHYPSELSGGQQQRVAIARALANSPSILIGDEITGNLDKDTSMDVMTLLARLSQTHGLTGVYVTHDAKMAKFAHRVVRLADGRLNTGRSNRPASTRGKSKS